MRMNDLIPGWDDFTQGKKEHIEPPIRTENLFEHVTDNDEWGEWNNAIPNTWLDDEGVAHVVIWDENQELRYKMIDGKLVDLKPETF